MLDHLRGIVVILLLAPCPALACSLVGPTPHTLVEARDDAEPPSTPEVGEVEIRRGVAPSGCMTTSCDDIGSVTLPLSAVDDQSGAEQIGYLLTLVEGTLPFELPSEAVRPQVAQGLILNWVDGTEREQEAIDALISIEAVDEAGNVSDEALLVDLRDPGRRGCASVPSAGALAVFGLVALRRRRGAYVR